MSAQAIGYLRVSTSEQGRSGLGLQAQRAEVEAFAVREGLGIEAWHQDVQTGAGKDALVLRPGLAQALKQAKAAKCPLIVSRLDRLSRNVHFITGLMESRVHFMVAALGKDCDDFTLHIYASLAEQERKMISERITIAIAASKRRGGKWGTDGRSKAWAKKFQATGVAALKHAANERAEAYRLHIEWALHQPSFYGGQISFWEAAKTLNERNIEAPFGGKWSSKQVSHMAKRLRFDHPKRFLDDDVARKIVAEALAKSPLVTVDQLLKSLNLRYRLGHKRATRLVSENRTYVAKNSFVYKRIGWPVDHWTECRIRIAQILRRSPTLFAWQVTERLGPEFKGRLDWVRKTMRDYRSGSYKPRAQVNRYWNRKYRARIARARRS
jgi:DNA invertase Pin-like site-specific DNA recombinase